MTAAELLERALAEADPRVRARGWELFRSGGVRRATRLRVGVRLWAQGNERLPYRIDLDLTRGVWACTCPYDWGSVCKHVLAALHALVETPDMVEPAGGSSRRLKVNGLSEDAVLELLAQLTERYPELLREYALALARELEDDPEDW